MRQKKLLSIMMAVVLSLCSLPITAVQAQETFPEEVLQKSEMEDFEKSVQEITPQSGNVKTTNNVWKGYRYEELEDGTLEITGYEGNNTELVIPAEIDGKRVTRIGDSTFFYDGSSLTRIELPEGVTSIGDNAFRGCSNLTRIGLPAGLSSIGSGTFYGCSSLTRIELPTGLSSIGGATFFGCSSLTRIELPEGVTSIGSYAFSYCSSLTEIAVDGNNTTYMSQDGILYDKNQKKLIRCPGGKTGNIVIPATVTSIGDSAFSGCRSLTGIELPEGVTSIGSYAFSSCRSLTGIELPEGVISIGSYAFKDCSCLTRIELPEGVTSIGDGAFGYCRNLTGIVADKNNITYMSQDGILYDKNRKELICCPEGKKGNIVIPESAVGIDEYAFDNCKDLVLLVCKGSYAEAYAKNYNLNYRYIDDIDNCSHTWDTNIVQATTKKNGSVTKTCTKCGKKTIETVYAVKNINLSKTSYTYNGKIHKPSVIVKNSKGKALKNKKDYTTTYSKNIKNVGSYIITIKLKGNYKDTVKKTFQIVPKGTKISKITPKKKGFVLKWNKQSVQTTGYEIAYSTNKKFTKKTTGTITIGKNKTVSKSVSKLKVRKKYFVKIRTYKTIKRNRKSKKLYSTWSKVKVVTTKK